jgi:hypothetical protein
MLETAHASTSAADGVATWVVGVGVTNTGATVLAQIASAGNTTSISVSSSADLDAAVRAAIDSVGCR